LPTYDYRCDCGEVVERNFPMDDIKQKVKCPACGKMAKKAVACPNAICRYSYFERSQGNPRVNRGKGR
jgi:putative FmdB family regulatory protein